MYFLKTFNVTSDGFIFLCQVCVKFFIIDLTTLVCFFYVDILKKFNILYLHILYEPVIVISACKTYHYCNLIYNQLPLDEPSGSKHVEDKKLKY